jgi:hypothetical protein
MAAGYGRSGYTCRDPLPTPDQRLRTLEEVFDLVFVEFTWSALNPDAFFNHYLGNLVAVEKNDWLLLSWPTLALPLRKSMS